jgi:predicted RNase H-like nuclease (RuvC/YqgF family)
MTVTKAKSKNWVPQRIDLLTTLDEKSGFQVPQSPAQDPYVVDMVKVYDTRIAQLETRLSSSEKARSELESDAEQLKAKIAAREKEIERLEGVVSGGKPLEQVVAGAKVRDKDAATRQMSLHVEYLEKTVGDLEKRLEGERR